jgi:hypothetical protein
VSSYRVVTAGAEHLFAMGTTSLTALIRDRAQALPDPPQKVH